MLAASEYTDELCKLKPRHRGYAYEVDIPVVRLRRRRRLEAAAVISSVRGNGKKIVALFVRNLLTVGIESISVFHISGKAIHHRHIVRGTAVHQRESFEPFEIVADRRIITG